MTRLAPPRAAILTAFLLIVAPVLSGCLSDDPAPEPEAATPAPPREEAPPTAAGSAAPTSGTPTRPAIALVSPPSEGSPFSSVEIRWTLAGAAGSTPHTAVHADTVSHPDAAALTPAAYPQTYYPGPGPYPIPSEHATKLTLPSAGTLYLRPHAIVAGQHVWGDEVAIRVAGPAATGVSLVKYPPAARAGVPFEIEWRVDTPGAASTPHTAIHYGAASVQKPSAELKPADYARATTFQNGSLPATFRATVTPSETGILYLRGHAVVDGKATWTEEVALAVGAPDAANVIVASLPATFTPGTPFEVKWRVNVPANATGKTTPHAAVHFGPVSTANLSSSELTPRSYPNATPFLNGTVPATFASMMTVPEGDGTVYLRAHVILDGVHLWSDESRITAARS